MSYHRNERTAWLRAHKAEKEKPMSDKAKPAYPAAPDAWPERDENPHHGGGTNDGVVLPPTPNAGRQPMPPAPVPINRGVDD